MKALLVGDNSSNQNWGGRGGSIALYQLLAKKFQITGTISGSTFILPGAGWPIVGRPFLFPNASFGYVNTLLPPRYNWLFLNLRANRHKSRILDYYLRIEELWGAKDFIALDPYQTVENILRYKGRHAELQEIYEKARMADVLVINGEGDMVFTIPAARETLFLLGMAELGLYLNKKVAFVNSIISDCPVTGRNVKTFEFTRSILSRCDAVLLRDYQSLEYVANEMPDVLCSLVPDSLFSWFPIIERYRSVVPANGDFILPFPENKDNLGKLDFSRPYICIGGSALAASGKEKAIDCFSRLLAKIQELNCPVYLTETCGGDSFLQAVAAQRGVGLVPVYTSVFMSGAILANAKLFVSGRYHPTILASLGGTPCIFLGSIGHKMRSIQKILEYENIREFSPFPSSSEIDEIFHLARGYLRGGERLRESIKAVAKRQCEEAMRLPDIILKRITNSVQK
jgi:hypothetical protein